MTGNENDPKTVHTGGAAYIGGGVSTGGGDFVGRDQVKTLTLERHEGASLAELAALLAEIRALLPQAGLDADTAAAIEGDFQVVETQAAKPDPKPSLIRTKLKSMAELIQEAGKTSDAADKILKLLGRGLALLGVTL